MRSENPPTIDFTSSLFFEPQYYLNLDDSVDESLFSTDKPRNIKKALIKVKQDVSKSKYISNVRALQKHILDGDIYEANYCMEFYSDNVIIDPVDIFIKLNALSPMPFASLFKSYNKYLICASPERFIKLEGNKIISQPIKGTIKAGKNSKENIKLIKELQNSDKERAENMMITDLVRNDLAKSSETGSVEVEEMFRIYSYSQLHQMVSTIASNHKNDIPICDIIKNAFPMGSMTGAPKIKAMELIERYETSKRGLYSGSVGYFDPKNNIFDFNVVIRSIIYDADENKLSYQVGSAITSDSDPEKEYEECLLKAEAINKVLNRC